MSEYSDKTLDFQVVCNKRKSRKTQKSYDSVDYNLRRIQSLKELLESSDYYLQLLNSIDKALNCSSASSNQGISQIISYGVGNFSDSIASKYQFVLLLLLKQNYQCEVLIYDPIFTEVEKILIKTFNLDLITENEECKRLINRKSLIYMPRCPIQLINNLLFTNWSKERLLNLILLSNSINKILETNTDTFLKTNLKFILSVENIVEEIILENNFKFDDIFNDTSLHYFEEKKLDSVDKNVWDFKSIEPTYDECNFDRTNS